MWQCNQCGRKYKESVHSCPYCRRETWLDWLVFGLIVAGLAIFNLVLLFA